MAILMVDFLGKRKVYVLLGERAHMGEFVAGQGPSAYACAAAGRAQGACA